MTDEEKKSPSRKQITEKERFKFIGFDVFPKEPKELFSSDAERDKLVEEVKARREQHDLIRESCTLMEERVSYTDRLVLTVANVVILIALFIPWYGAYNEIVEETPPAQIIQEKAVPGEDVSAVAQDGVDATAESEQPVAGTQPEVTTDEVATEGGTDAPEYTTITEEERRAEAGEEIITAITARKKVHKEYSRLSGVGAIISLGRVGSYLFSSGISLMLTVILFIFFTLLCIGLPAYTLFSLYGSKGDSDVIALKFKKLLRLHWIPLVIFLFCLLLSFFGSDYGFDAGAKFTSIGESYSPMAYLGTLSWGVFISLGGFILCAAKGAEI